MYSMFAEQERHAIPRWSLGNQVEDLACECSSIFAGCMKLLKEVQIVVVYEMVAH